MLNTDGHLDDYRPNPYLVENVMAQRTMQRLQDLGIKDVYSGLNENSSSTLQGMGTM